MPKETFFNLPEDKRTHITNIAIDEFANHDYAEVSISRMVARAGIAKGSFYQYFDDKEDLYTYLLDLCVKKKWEVLGLDTPDPYHVGVFRYLIWTAQASVQLQVLYPDLVKIAFRAHNSNAFPAEFMEHAQRESHHFFLRLVQIGKEQGDISPEVDNELAAFIFNSIFTNLGQFLIPRINVNEVSQQSGDIFFTPEVMALYEQTVKILQRGLGGSQTHQENAILSKVQEGVQ